MAPTRTTKQSSREPVSASKQMATMADQRVPIKIGTPHQRSPIKRRRGGITLDQKQAIIDNLQLEITDRARRLRAQYNAQAQSLRSRIEIRVNRIPRALLKSTMGDLLLKCVEQQKRLAAATRPPPVPEKDFPPRSPQKSFHASQASVRPQKRLSDEMAGADKENENEQIENPKKRQRARPAAAAPVLEASQVLSPTSSNARSAPRHQLASSPPKSQIARPASPMKPPPTARSGAAISNIASMVEKSKTGRAAPARKATTSSNTSSSSSGTTAATRTRRAAPAAAKAPPARTARRISDSSDGSTATVVKKSIATKPAPAPAAKRTVMGTIRKGMAGATTKKATATKPAATATGTTRVLRKRG